MKSTRVTVTIDRTLLAELDELITQNIYSSRSQAIQEALEEKLARMRRNHLAMECARLDPQHEQALAEEGMGPETSSWPRY
jgi:metal-responsive CopG/Arc/MetJ family transcriptional regulator